MNGCGFVDIPKNRRSKTKYVEIFYQNVRGLRTKVDKFWRGIACADSDLFAITETGCNESIQDFEIIPSGYTIIRCDRMDGRKQGGACLVATPRLELRPVSTPSNINIDSRVFELVCVKVYLGERFLFFVVVVYIPPSSSDNEYMLLFNLIEQFCSKYNKVIVLGDFNLYSCTTAVRNYYEYFVTYCGFTQSNNIGNCNDRQLDLVLSTFGEGGDVRVCAAHAGLVPVDAQHPPLEVVVQLRLDTDARVYSQRRADECLHSARPAWNFNKADFPILYNAIEMVDWSPMYDLDLEKSLDFFYNTINAIIDSCALRKNISSPSSGYVYPVWYTAKIIRELKLKAGLHKNYKRSNSKCDYDIYFQCRARVKSMIKFAHEEYQTRIQNHLMEDPKAFWNYIKSKRGSCNKRKNF